MLDLAEVAVGARIECGLCGETLRRETKSDVPTNDFVEVASGKEHQCWEQLPANAEHLRLD